MRELEVLKELLLCAKARKEKFVLRGQELQYETAIKDINALSSAIRLMEQLEKVEGVLPKEYKMRNTELGELMARDIWTRFRQEVKLNLAKVGLVRKPTGEEIEKVIDEVAYQGIPAEQYGLNIGQIAKAIIAKLSEEGR